MWESWLSVHEPLAPAPNVHNGVRSKQPVAGGTIRLTSGLRLFILVHSWGDLLSHAEPLNDSDSQKSPAETRHMHALQVQSS